jgi:hypothetical protein
MVTSTYTGRTRLRLYKPLFRKPLLVLEVEIRVTGYQVTDANGGGRDLDYTHWRDATIEDQTVGQMTIKKVLP